MKQRQVLVIQSVAGIHLHSKSMGLFGGETEAVQFPSRGGRRMKGLSERPGVQFDKLSADPRRRFDLFFVWRDEEADLDAGVV